MNIQQYLPLDLKAELKRKMFHHLALIYMALFAILPRIVVVPLFFLLTAAVGTVEFLRLRRPEINAWFMERFQKIVRASEVMRPSGIFWTLAGCSMTMLIFTNKKIILASIGFLVFADAAAALGGKKWGKHRWKQNPDRTWEGSACFALAAFLWGLFFLSPLVALVGALVCAWIEMNRLPWNDNFWIPLSSGLVLSILNLTPLGRFHF